MDQLVIETRDREMMTRCIALSREAAADGEFPFACVIARGGEVIVETKNRVAREKDVTRHAELVAVSEAQRKLGTTRLSGCTLYTVVEPCPMCSFPMREARISRVVYAIPSPLMGGASRFNVLGDPIFSDKMSEVFGKPPEVIRGVMQKEAERVWLRAKPLAWGVIRWRGVFGGDVGPREVRDPTGGGSPP